MVDCLLHQHSATAKAAIATLLVHRHQHACGVAKVAPEAVLQTADVLPQPCERGEAESGVSFLGA